MAYSINPCLVKARKTALLMLLNEQLPINLVARKCGVHRTTVWRWYKKWQVLNQYTSQVHYGRPSRQTKFCASYYSWTIRTESARPHSCPRALPQAIVNRVLELRQQLKRCAEVIWHYLKLEGVVVSLSSVRRILARHHQYDRPKYAKKLYRRNIKRPLPERSGDLVQIDTVHLVDPSSHTRKYVYTVIDLCTRMAYARVYPKLSQISALETVLIAQTRFGFKFRVVQADNGAEFGYLFKDRLEAKGMTIRHTRPHRPNDNAHIERFNRTLRHECIGRYMSSHYTIQQVQRKLNGFIDFYNHERVHLSLQCMTPVEFCQGVLQRF
jgi:transposase InsO family protein